MQFSVEQQITRQIQSLRAISSRMPLAKHKQDHHSDLNIMFWSSARCTAASSACNLHRSTRRVVCHCRQLTSTVGLPRESMIVRPRTEVILLIDRGAVARAKTRAACLDSIAQLNNQAQ
eukprot:11166-Heterococcus_DN1.PRE.1